MNSRIQKPVFDESLITHKGSSELIAELRPILQKQISATKYDRVVIAEQFLNHLGNQDPLEALHSFEIDSSLKKNNGNSCVGLSLDLSELIGNRANTYLAAASLSNRYQQFAGPTYCHVTPMIRFKNPRNPKDCGYIIVDPSFHIAEPILLLEDGQPFIYDMGGKKGIWTFYIEKDKIICQASSRAQEVPWSAEQLQSNRMIYRTDRILNPETSSALPMFAIDRSYPIVARRSDGSQVAHLNLELNQRRMSWKIGEEKKPHISFNEIANQNFVFDQQTADLFLIPLTDLNHSIRKIATSVRLLDAMYGAYLKLLQSSDEFRSLLKNPSITIHHCRTVEPYLSLIQKGTKKIEGRTFSPKYQQFRPGDVLHLYNENNETWCTLKGLRNYKTFQEMLLSEGLEKVVPNAKTIEEGISIYSSFPNFREEREYGVVALDVEL